MRLSGWLVGTVAATLVGACSKPVPSRAAIMADLNNLRQIVALVVASGERPTKDGALDVNALVRSGNLTRDRYSILRSVRSGTGPTDEEIERGDYTNSLGSDSAGRSPGPIGGRCSGRSNPTRRATSSWPMGDGSAQILDKQRLDQALGK